MYALDFSAKLRRRGWSLELEFLKIFIQSQYIGNARKIKSKVIPTRRVGSVCFESYSSFSSDSV